MQCSGWKGSEITESPHSFTATGSTAICCGRRQQRRLSWGFEERGGNGTAIMQAGGRPDRRLTGSQSEAGLYLAGSHVWARIARRRWGWPLRAENVITLHSPMLSFNWTILLKKKKRFPRGLIKVVHVTEQTELQTCKGESKDRGHGLGVAMAQNEAQALQSLTAHDAWNAGRIVRIQRLLVFAISGVIRTLRRIKSSN